MGGGEGGGDPWKCTRTHARLRIGGWWCTPHIAISAPRPHAHPTVECCHATTVAHRAKNTASLPTSPLPWLAAALAFSLPEPTFFRMKPGPAHKQSLATGMYAPGSIKVPAVNDVSAWRLFSHLKCTPHITPPRRRDSPQGHSDPESWPGWRCMHRIFIIAPSGRSSFSLLASLSCACCKSIHGTHHTMIFLASWLYTAQPLPSPRCQH